MLQGPDAPRLSVWLLSPRSHPGPGMLLSPQWDASSHSQSSSDPEAPNVSSYLKAGAGSLPPAALEAGQVPGRPDRALPRRLQSNQAQTPDRGKHLRWGRGWRKPPGGSPRQDPFCQRQQSLVRLVTARMGTWPVDNLQRRKRPRRQQCIYDKEPGPAGGIHSFKLWTPAGLQGFFPRQRFQPGGRLEGEGKL